MQQSHTAKHVSAAQLPHAIQELPAHRDPRLIRRQLMDASIPHARRPTDRTQPHIPNGWAQIDIDLAMVAASTTRSVEAGCHVIVDIEHAWPPKRSRRRINLVRPRFSLSCRCADVNQR